MVERGLVKAGMVGIEREEEGRRGRDGRHGRGCISRGLMQTTRPDRGEKAWRGSGETMVVVDSNAGRFSHPPWRV